MSKNEISNMAHSVNARLNNLARQRNMRFDYVLLRYALERFLYRLSLSLHAERFILKGASAFSVWMGPLFRVTRDADLHCSGDSQPEFLLQCFRDICSVDVPSDGVIFDIEAVEIGEIKKDQLYKGTRISFPAYISQARVILQFDIGFGDSVFPNAEIYEYPVLLESEKPKIRVYPQYTVIAEKFEAMITLSMKNSRLKDFFDIWLLSECFDFDFLTLQQALKRTFARRKIPFPAELPLALTEEFFADPLKMSQWNAFLRKVNPTQHPASLAIAAGRISALLTPVIRTPDSLPTTWHAAQGWR